MDVRLPDGTVVTNVPDGISQSELMRRLGRADMASKRAEIGQKAAAAGMSMTPEGGVNWRAELEKQADAEMSMPQRLFKSLGAGFADIPLAVRQIINRDPEQAKVLEREAATKRDVDKALAKSTNLGLVRDKVFGMETPTLGSMAQMYGKVAPTMAVPAAPLGSLGLVGNAALVGSGLAALEPTVDGESRLNNMIVGGITSPILPLASAAIRGGTGAVTRRGGERKAADEVARTLAEGADEQTVLRQTIDRLRQQQQPSPGGFNIPLTTAAQLRDADLARLEAGSRTRSGANWYDFDQGQARAVSDALRTATAQADDLAARRKLRKSNRELNFNQAMGTINEPAFAQNLQGFRSNLEVAMRSAEAANPAVRNMLVELRNQIDEFGPDFSPAHLANIRATLSKKAPLVPQNAFEGAPRSSPATMSVLREVDDILNNVTGNRWQKVVGDYARDSDAVRAAQAAGKVREAFWDPTGQVRKMSADPAGDVPMITEFGLRQAINSTKGPQGNLLLSAQANDRLNAIVDALRAQGIVRGVKRSATAGGGSDTASNQYAAQAAGRAAEALGASGSMTAAGTGAVLNRLSAMATANKDRALAEALQNPQQMIAILERKLAAGAPLGPEEQYLLTLLRGVPAAAATSQ
jgi:hypothetical protein